MTTSTLGPLTSSSPSLTSSKVVVSISTRPGPPNVHHSLTPLVGTLVNAWHSSGKKVVFSVGGQNGNWAQVFVSQANMQNFANAAAAILKQYNLDGIDFDLEAYQVSPLDVAKVILLTRTAFDGLGSHKLIVLSPECVGVYQAAPVTNSSG